MRSISINHDHLGFCLSHLLVVAQTANTQWYVLLIRRRDARSHMRRSRLHRFQAELRYTLNTQLEQRESPSISSVSSVSSVSLLQPS